MTLFRLRLNLIHNVYGAGYYRNITCYKPNVLIFNWRQTRKKVSIWQQTWFAFLWTVFTIHFQPRINKHFLFRERGYSMCNIFQSLTKFNWWYVPPYKLSKIKIQVSWASLIRGLFGNFQDFYSYSFRRKINYKYVYQNDNEDTVTFSFYFEILTFTNSLHFWLLGKKFLPKS